MKIESVRMGEMVRGEEWKRREWWVREVQYDSSVIGICIRFLLSILGRLPTSRD